MTFGPATGHLFATRDDHMFQIIYKFHHAWQGYGSDTNNFH